MLTGRGSQFGVSNVGICNALLPHAVMASRPAAVDDEPQEVEHYKSIDTILFHIALTGDNGTDQSGNLG